jgi:hypothetical protein
LPYGAEHIFAPKDHKILTNEDLWAGVDYADQEISGLGISVRDLDMQQAGVGGDLPSFNESIFSN